MTASETDAPSWLADAEAAATHERWLLELTDTPTAAGHEDRVIAWIERWVAERPELVLERDEHGNLTIRRTEPVASDGPMLVIQAHLDHPAFIVEDRAADGSLDLTFRGGVKDPYFVDGRIAVLGDGDVRHGATITASEALDPLRRCRAVLDDPSLEIAPGTMAVWDLPAATIEHDRLHAPAVDDLAGVAAALSAFDVLRTGRGVADGATQRDVRLFFTRAEEIGFIGTIAACRTRSIPDGAEVLTLETSRSFADSPIGAGPIVRVGDRVSTFDPRLTAVVGEVATAIAKEHTDFLWQRKLMAGGACEATVYVRSGYAATCVCLPLGNYHNMAELDHVERETPAVATVGPEFIAVRDYHGLVRLLVGVAVAPAGEDPVLARIDRRFEAVGWVLDR